MKINGQNYEISETSSVFLKKYLERMKSYIEINNIEIEVYEDIEERISEKFTEIWGEISDKSIIDIVNEIWEPDEIFSELLSEKEETKGSRFQKNAEMNFKKYFSDKNEPLTKCDENSIIDGVCSGIAKRYGIDALWLRLAFVCGLFLWGSTIILYIVLMFILPDDKSKKKRNKPVEVKEKNEFRKSAEKKLDSTKKQLEAIPEKAKVLGKQFESSQVMKNTSGGISGFFKKIVKSLCSFFKKLIYVLFNVVRIGVGLVFLVAAIPALLSLLFVVGITFVQPEFNGQLLFADLSLFLKIWLVWLLFSFVFLSIWIFLKFMYGKIFANALMISGLLWIFAFVFVSGIGFFQTFDNFSNVYTQKQSLEIEGKSIQFESLDFIWWEEQMGGNINWVDNFDIISKKSWNLTIEIETEINRKNQKDADEIFKKLTPITLTNNEGIVTIDAEKSTAFSEPVNYAFLRKNIKIYVPEDVVLNIWRLDYWRLPYVHNMFNENNHRIYRLWECENKMLKFNNELWGFQCITKIQNNIEQ